MLATATVTNPSISVTVQLGGLASCVVSGPTGSGKSSVARAFDILLTGECPAGWSASGTTARGTVLSVTPRTRKITPAGGGAATYTSAEDYRRALWRGAPAEPATIRAILHADAWQAALATPKARGFRDLVLSVVPAGDLRAVVADLVSAQGHALRDDDPLHLDDDGPRGAKVPGALTRQAEANRLATHAQGILTSEWDAVRREEAALARLPQVDAEARKAAAAVLSSAAAWEAYDKALAAHRAAESRAKEASERLAAWEAATAAAGPRPAFDPAEAHRVRTALGEARAALRAEQEAAASARAAAAAEEAARRAVEEERARAAAPAPEAPPVAPLFATTPTIQPCPTCGQPWSR